MHNPLYGVGGSSTALVTPFLDTPAIPNALSSVFSADWLPVCGGSNAGRNKRPVKAAARRRRRSIGANGPSSRTQHKL